MTAAIVNVCLLAVVSSALASPPALPATPAPVDEVIYLRPFTLQDVFRFGACQEPFEITSGTILVLRVNPALVIPRAAAQPVLYVGNVAAMRLNHGHESGRVIAVVPGTVDLTKDPIWFGTPDLPGHADSATVQAERIKADQAGIKPVSAEKAQAARMAGGERVSAVDMGALLRDTLAPLVEQYSPQEKALADSWRLPVVKAPGQP